MNESDTNIGVCPDSGVDVGSSVAEYDSVKESAIARDITVIYRTVNDACGAIANHHGRTIQNIYLRSNTPYADGSMISFVERATGMELATARIGYDDHILHIKDKESGSLGIGIFLYDLVFTNAAD